MVAYPDERLGEKACAIVVPALRDDPRNLTSKDGGEEPGRR